jgi:hypothetical protein
MCGGRDQSGVGWLSLLCHLSYGTMVAPAGLEPATRELRSIRHLRTGHHTHLKLSRTLTVATAAATLRAVFDGSHAIPKASSRTSPAEDIDVSDHAAARQPIAQKPESLFNLSTIEEQIRAGHATSNS